MVQPSTEKIIKHNAAEKNLFASDTVVASENKAEHLKYLLLVRLQERENNLL
jgi:hypothetical protein